MRRFLPLALLLLPLPALAQQSDEQLWFQASASVPVSAKARLTIESIGRFSDRAGGFSHDEFGGLLSYTVRDGVEIAVGYRHVDDYDQGRAKPNEERIRQQVLVTLGGGFSGRLRFEQRFQSTSSAVGVRVRPQLRFTLPIGSGFSIFATQEHFVNLNTTRWGQRGGYERMRNAVGISIPLSPKLKGDIGYLNQYRFGRAGARDQMDHAATFSLTLTL